MSAHRARILDAIAHRPPDRVPVDFGATTVTGIHCSLVAALRDRLGLDRHPIKINEPYQMLGLMEADLLEALDVDTTVSKVATTHFGFLVDGERWKEWRTPWGQEVLIPAGMEVETLPDGDVVLFPQGDRSARPSAKMPSSSFFFDAIMRQGEYDEENPDPVDNTEEFQPLSDAVVDLFAKAAVEARATGRAVLAALPGTTLGSVSGVPGMGLKNPKGLRSIADWYMALATLPEFVKGIFAIQTEVALENLKRLHQAVGDNYDVVMVCGADFGNQLNTMFSVQTLNELFSPFYRRLNGWIHDNTNWKTFKHSCGAVEPLIESFIADGFDILNPVQCSAAGMDAARLKEKYGRRVTFWGGGVDTQRVLPFGTPEEVRRQVLERCRIFSPGGGFVFNTVHNLQALTPPENVMAMFAALREFDQAGRE